MGKIVRGAKVTEQAYVVAVPEVATVEAQRRATRDLDDRFASSHDALAFEDAGLDDLFDEPILDVAPTIPAVDMERVRADARALVDAAAADGESILQDAARRARELVDAAQKRVAEIEAEARTRGHQDGAAAGEAAAKAELADAVASMHELVESVRAQRHEVIESAEPELVRLAMGVAERIVHDQVSIDPNVVVENVRHALTRLIGREVVTLRVNPADLETIRQHRDAIAAGNDVEHLRVVEDQRVDRGGVVVETDAGTIDAKVSTQIREARRALASGDTIAVSQQAS